MDYNEPYDEKYTQRHYSQKIFVIKPLLSTSQFELSHYYHEYCARCYTRLTRVIYTLINLSTQSCFVFSRFRQPAIY